MSKIFITLVFLIGFIESSKAQTYQIVSGQSTIHYLRSKPGGNSSTAQPVEVKVVFSGNAPVADIPLNFVITNPYVIAIPLAPAVVNIPVGGYVLPATRFGASPDTITFTVNISINATPVITRNEFFDLQLAGFATPANPSHRVNVEATSTEDAEADANSKKKNKFAIGAISIGHSFDFFNKENALISYADAYIFSPNSFSIGEHAKADRFGFAIKLYQNKSLTTDSLNQDGSLYKFINQSLVNPLQPPVNDSVLLKQEFLSRKASSQSDNWGVYLRVFKDISYINKKIKFFLGVHAELLRRNITTTYSYQSERDTIIKVKSDKIPAVFSTPLSKNDIQTEFYIAPYMELFHADDDVSVLFSVIPYGFNIYRQTALNNHTQNRGFFMGQFDLVLKKLLNIKLGAEWRGYYGDQIQPYWNVFISKSFSWEKLKELIE